MKQKKTKTKLAKLTLSPKFRGQPSPKLRARPSPKLRAQSSPKLKAKPSPKLKVKRSPKLKSPPSPKQQATKSPKLKPHKKPTERKRKQDTQEGSRPAKQPRGVGSEVDHTLPLENFPEMSSATCDVLKKRGIASLFEIQCKSFQPVFQGKDVVGKAKTGCGKTLAFVLPVVARVCSEKPRRKPLCLAVAPTRELARQIFSDFECIGGANGLQARCLTGGTPFGPQCQELRGGIELLVCTPGRILDHIKRCTVDLSRCRVLVLDEADEMLNMGFQEDVEAIMEALPKEPRVQKLLFSATMPRWVESVVQKHLLQPASIDVTDGASSAANSKIVHKCVACPPWLRGDCIGDLCKVHAGHFGKTLVFTGTKKECDELAANEKLSTLGAAVLHGDVAQNQRESVMEGFRSGRIRCLVATDVAARGLDVPNVDLVVQTRPPQDLDSYVHRAGRTARAGKEGVCITFYSQKEEYIIRLLEHKKGIRMQRVGPPQAQDVVKAAALDAVAQLDHVHQDSAEAFMQVAKQLIDERGAEEALAAALAALTGHSRQLKGRSLLSAMSGCTAMILKSERGIEATSKGWYLLRQMFGEDAQVCRGLLCCKDGTSCIFDAPDDAVPRLLAVELWRGMSLQRAEELPPLADKEWDPYAASQQLRDSRQAWRQGIQRKKDDTKEWKSFAGRGRGDSGSQGRAGNSGRGGRGIGRGRG